MASALVVGDRGSGLTTFVGLLYAAQLRLGTEEQDDFRFSAERETIRQLEAIYGELTSGRFPEWDVNWEEHPLSFLLAFRSGRLGALTGRRGGANGSFDTVELKVGGISVEEVSDLAAHDALLDESTRRLLRSSVVLPLVDASRLLPPPDGENASLLSRYDRMLATTLEHVSQFLALERNRKARLLNPLFVVTKFDRCPPQTLADLAAPSGPPAAWPTEARITVGGRILERYLPVTGRFIAESVGAHMSKVAAPLWFFSSLRVDPDNIPPRIVRRSRVPEGGWEPEYPFEEYRNLIRQLGRLAHRLPRETENA